MNHCEICQVVEPTRGGLCKLCSVSSTLISATSGFSREMVAAFLFSIRELDDERRAP